METKTLECIALSAIVALTAGSMIWSYYNTSMAKVAICDEAKKLNVSPYELCKKKGRTDVIDLLTAEDYAKNIPTYIPVNNSIIPIAVPDNYNKKEK